MWIRCLIWWSHVISVYLWPLRSFSSCQVACFAWLTLQLAVQGSLLQETVAAAQQGEAVVTSIKGKSSHSERFCGFFAKEEISFKQNINSLTSSSSAGAIRHSCGRNNQGGLTVNFETPSVIHAERLVTFRKFANLQGPQHLFNRFQMASNQWVTLSSCQFLLQT